MHISLNDLDKPLSPKKRAVFEGLMNAEDFENLSDKVGKHVRTCRMLLITGKINLVNSNRNVVTEAVQICNSKIKYYQRVLKK